MDNTNQSAQHSQENHETLKVSTSSDPHHFPKILLIGIGTVLILIIGTGIGYFMGINNQPITDQTPSPTPLPAEASAKVGVDETANWKTYTNAEFSFQFKHPPMLLPVVPDQNASETPLVELPLPEIDDYASFSIFVITGQIELPKSSAKDEIFTYNNGLTKMIKHPPKDYFVASIKGQKQVVDFEDDNTGNFTFETVYFIHNNKMYQLRMRYYTKDKNQLSELLDQILSTFQFTP